MKAIIMAGGEGTRLRPLTCDCPKPMIRLMNRPVMQYALELLKAHGITRVAATLGYLPDAVMDHFGGGDDFGVDLRYYIEKTPLGTAGGVKQASDFLDETFVVLSGDGITDLDITAALAFHRARGALATLVLKHADNPLDYGVVLTDSDGRVRSFHEKPDWSDVISDTVNTGIYILEPQALEHVPPNRLWDFGHDLFPDLVRQGLPVYGYVMQGYWCDVGDVRAYLAAHQDAMEGRIRLDSLKARSGGRVVQFPGASVDRAAVLEGPCVIGPNARILPGAYVGPYSVVGQDCVVGEGASVKRAVLWPGARLERSAQARGCVLACGASIGAGAQAYEESVLGTGASVGERAVLLPGVKLWPGKRGADGERLESNLVWGNRPESGFDRGLMALSSPAQAVRAVQALVSVLKPGELLLGRTEGGEACAMWHAVLSGAMSQGVQVQDAGVCTLPQLRCAQTLLRCGCAALVKPDGLLPLSPLGARLSGRQQRAVAARNARQDFDSPFVKKALPAVSLGFTDSAYIAQAAARFSADPARVPPIALFAGESHLLALADRAFRRAGLATRVAENKTGMELAPNEIGVGLTNGGESWSLMDEAGALTDGEQQLMAAWTALELGERTLLLPVQATRAVRILADAKGARAEYVAGEGGSWHSALAERFPLQFALQCDGIAAALAALSALINAGLGLSDWRRLMPPVSRRSRSIPIPASQTGRVLRSMAQRERCAELGGGMRFSRENGWAWICPDERKPEFRIIAEAASEEYARELCDFCESELKRLAGEK